MPLLSLFGLSASFAPILSTSALNGRGSDRLSPSPRASAARSCRRRRRCPSCRSRARRGSSGARAARLRASPGPGSGTADARPFESDPSVSDWGWPPSSFCRNPSFRRDRSRVQPNPGRPRSGIRARRPSVPLLSLAWAWASSNRLEPAVPSMISGWAGATASVASASKVVRPVVTSAPVGRTSTMIGSVWSLPVTVIVTPSVIWIAPDESEPSISG